MKCSACGGSVERARQPQYQRRYCSEECRLELIRRRSKMWRGEHPEVKRERNARRKRRNDPPEKKAARAEYARQWYWKKLLGSDAPIPSKRQPRSKELVLSDVLWGRARRTIKSQSVLILTGAICPECGVAFVYTGTVSNRYCSPLCGKRYSRRQRRGRRSAALVEPVFRHKVFERDGWRCQICRKLVSRKAVVPHPRAPTIDHIVPLNVGGEHSMANAQTAHFMCNAEKRDLARNDQLRLVG